MRSCLRLIDVGSCALHDRLEPAEPHRDQLPNTGLSIRPFIDHREPLCLGGIGPSCHMASTKAGFTPLIATVRRLAYFTLMFLSHRENAGAGEAPVPRTAA